MSAIPAIFEQGVFRPIVPVHLPEGTKVSVTTPDENSPTIEENRRDGLDAIYEVLNRRYRSGFHDTAERHNEHQP